MGDQPLDAIAEDEDSEESEEAILPRIPQAFSHFTYRKSKRRMLVCDLQGVLTSSTSPPLFELTDPVIHYRSFIGRQNAFGRTDRGKRGIHNFFKTHVCTELCRMLNRRIVHR